MYEIVDVAMFFSFPFRRFFSLSLSHTVLIFLFVLFLFVCLCAPSRVGGLMGKKWLLMAINYYVGFYGDNICWRSEDREWCLSSLIILLKGTALMVIFACFLLV